MTQDHPTWSAWNIEPWGTKTINRHGIVRKEKENGISSCDEEGVLPINGATAGITTGLEKSFVKSFQFQEKREKLEVE